MSIFSLYDFVMVTYPLALFGMDLTCKLKTAKTNKQTKQQPPTTTFICVFANGFFITFPVFLIMFGAPLWYAATLTYGNELWAVAEVK